MHQLPPCIPTLPLHAALPFFVLTTVHALSAGTDRQSFLLRWGVIGTCVAVTVLTFIRVRQVDRRPAPPAPQIGRASCRERVRISVGAASRQTTRLAPDVTSQQ